MTSGMRRTLLVGSVGLALSACAHRGQPVERKTVSTVSNQDLTGDTAARDGKRMRYTRVSNEDALNHDASRVEHEALHGSLNRGDAPTPALRASDESRRANAE